MTFSPALLGEHGIPPRNNLARQESDDGHFQASGRGRVALAKLNLDGDRQADLSVHGGEYKAVYCYPIEHYAYWKRQLPGRELPVAVFGENFTTAGLTESSVHLGDR